MALFYWICAMPPCLGSIKIDVSIMMIYLQFDLQTGSLLFVFALALAHVLCDSDASLELILKFSGAKR